MNELEKAFAMLDMMDDLIDLADVSHETLTLADFGIED